MHVGIAGPISLDMLRGLVAGGGVLPRGNAFPFLAALVREYLARGLTVSVFTHRGNSGEDAAMPHGAADGTQVLHGERLTVHVGPFRPSAAARALDLFALERAALARAMRADPCDVVHAHWTYEFALAALDSGLPTLVTPRDWAPTILRMQRRPRSLAYRFARLLMSRRVLRRARHITVASPYMLDLLRRHGHPGAVLVPNGIEDELLASEPRSGPSEAWRIASVNNGFQRRKNVETLLEAFALLRAGGHAASLALAGRQFEPGGRAEAWARRRGLAQGVAFRGPLGRTEILRLLGEADLLAHPALEESFGNTLLEAMAQGTPVVGGERSGAVPWVLDGGKAGALCNVRSPRALAAEAAAVLSDAERWRRLSAAGLACVRDNFTVSHVTSAYLAEYKRVAASGG